MKSIIIRFLFFFSTTFLLSYQVKSQDDSKYNKGRECCAIANWFYIQNEFSASLHWYEKSLQFSYNDLSVFYGRARCNYELGKYNESMADFSTVIRLFPKNSKQYVPLMECYVDYLINNCYNKRLKLSIKEILNQYVTSIRYFETHDLNTNILDLIDAPKSWTEEDVLNAMNECFDPPKHIPVAFLDKTNFDYRVHPSLSNCYWSKGACRYLLNDYVGSIQDFRKCHKINNDSTAESCYIVANALFQLKQYKRTIDYCNHIIKTDPTFEKIASTMYFLGMSQYIIGDKIKGCENMRNSADLGDKDASDFISKYCN